MVGTREETLGQLPKGIETGTTARPTESENGLGKRRNKRIGTGGIVSDATAFRSPTTFSMIPPRWVCRAAGIVRVGDVGV